MQLDLFLHGRDVMLQNDVVAALLQRDVVNGRKTLELFAAEFPRHEMLSPLSTLLDESFSLLTHMVFEAQRHSIAIRMRCRDFERVEQPRRFRFAFSPHN